MYSAMFVVNAMTSWFVTFSISSMRSTVKSACARIHAASSFVIPDFPSSACASHASTSISFQRGSAAPKLLNSRARVTVDHAGPFPTSYLMATSIPQTSPRAAHFTESVEPWARRA